MPNGAKIKKGISTWQKIFNPSLSSFILKKAQDSKIEQAILINVTAGYLKGRKLAYGIGEVIPKEFPAIIELIDEEKNLRDFYKDISAHLGECIAYISILEEPV